jgi:hypothetical protein
LNWTRATHPDEAVQLLPAWFGARMVGARGSFGLLLTTGDVMRCTSIAAVHLSSPGIALLDVMLDGAGVPDGVDLAWRAKHYLGLPVPAATLATVNLAHVIAVVEFIAAEFAETRTGDVVPFSDELDDDATATAARTDAISRLVE